MILLVLFHTSIVMPAAAAKLLQSCPTLCDPIYGSPPGSPIPGILQARTLEWVAISFSNAWKWTVKGKSFRRVQLLATSWTAAHQAPLSMGFSRQEYWSGVPLPSQKKDTETQMDRMLCKWALSPNKSPSIYWFKTTVTYFLTVGRLGWAQWEWLSSSSRHELGSCSRLHSAHDSLPHSYV